MQRSNRKTLGGPESHGTDGGRERPGGRLQSRVGGMEGCVMGGGGKTCREVFKVKGFGLISDKYRMI